MESILNINRCPECGHTHITVSVTTWADFVNGEPISFDDEDIEEVVPVIGDSAICRQCQHQWPIAALPT